MEDGPWNVRAFKELFCHVQRRSDVPGDEVHIAAEKSGGSASEGENLRAIASGEHFLQLVPEVEDLIRSFFFPEGIQGIAEEARHCAVGMERVHEVIVGIQIAVDEWHAVGGTGHYIQPPIGVRVLFGFHFVTKVALQIGFRVGGELQALLPQFVGQLGQEEGRLCLGFLQHIKAVYVSHVGDLAQHLVGEGSEHPPGPAFFLLKLRQQLFTVSGDGKAVFTLFLQPDLHIIPGNLPAIIGSQTDVLNRLTAHQDVPVLQHLFRSVLLEVDQLKQFDFVALWGEDQLMLFAIEAHLEGDFVKRLVQSPFHLGHEFCAAGVIFVLIHHLAQFCFHLDKGFPPVLCPLPEALPELRQRNTLLAPVDKLFGVIVTRADFQCLFKISQSPALLIQIKVGVTHAEVPVIIVLEVFLMGL